MKKDFDELTIADNKAKHCTSYTLLSAPIICGRL